MAKNVAQSQITGGKQSQITGGFARPGKSQSDPTVVKESENDPLGDDGPSPALKGVSSSMPGGFARPGGTQKI